MSYEKDRIKKELHELGTKISQYRSKPTKSDNYLSWMERLKSSIEQYIKSNDEEYKRLVESHKKELKPHIEVIKKQAIIIELAGVEYPTINQSLGYLTDCLKSKNKDITIGTGTDLNVTIKLLP